MKKVLIVFGTRPEAIKMVPLIKAFEQQDDIHVKVCVTAQHREMLDQVLEFFEVNPDYDLNLMQNTQDLTDVTSNVLLALRKVLVDFDPDLVLVHGDTSTTFASALACFYEGIPVGHVEAGLRTYNIFSPYPEEFNRQVTSIVSKFHFAPTILAKENLIREGKDPSKVFVTGNTAIDALLMTQKNDYSHEILSWAGEHRLVLLTAHRRENLGAPMESMFRAIRRVLDENESIKIVYPIHMNPDVRKIANKHFQGADRLRIIEPLDVFDFHNVMRHAFIVLTDSGGIQEEAPTFGIPVIVMRDTTERPEGVEAGTLLLVGTSEERIYTEFTRLLNDEEVYKAMSHASNPYGDGNAAKRIVRTIKEYFESENYA